ncbi:NACHT domain-containing protein [Ramlibacter sp. RBP-2]|uniref:NACHT domain-containing protein n=1 Tax=Ramlibacter lithotrophicus TaxID=2606681 RepID=A0A7X6DDW4_9BURK|nr:restriction endonuclease [Ramlibacter lithotrophicus]NKE65356.1 NACHT domain-containing protein [Ramlibacter lithotrophicus]
MTSIHIFHKGTNERGDLFARLMSDLFVALGYGVSRLNIHKSGREIDLSARHRLEQRKAIAECKATNTPVGGSDLNKFVGALDAESDKSALTEGYFISLSGFTETAIEQELGRKKTKLCLLTGERVVDELVQGRILVSKERATEIAGRLCGTQQQFELDLNLELLVHERGLVWAVFYTQGKQRTHVALIHADGTPLAAGLAAQIIGAYAEYTGTDSDAICLNRSQTTKCISSEERAHALTLYQQYVVNECGTIQLDGLPADSDVGSRRLMLEALFVPLHLDLPDKERTRVAAGTALTEFSRIALLAAPGGGKSTLLKRIAVAYADPTRRLQIDDLLPDRKWLPLFFRCRELRGLTRSSFADLTEALCNREPVRQAAEAFKKEIDDALTEGRVLLLVDGLDEIGDPGDRASFVCTLRTALLAYPDTAIVVTSRSGISSRCRALGSGLHHRYAFSV